MQHAYGCQWERRGHGVIGIWTPTQDQSAGVTGPGTGGAGGATGRPQGPGDPPPRIPQNNARQKKEKSTNKQCAKQ